VTGAGAAAPAATAKGAAAATNASAENMPLYTALCLSRPQYFRLVFASLRGQFRLFRITTAKVKL